MDCTRLGDKNYQYEDQKGLWMRIPAFKQWIDGIIEEATKVGMELINQFDMPSFILGHFSEVLSKIHGKVS